MNEIRIPRLGWSMEEGVFVGWLKRSGDAVAVGDALFEMEGEKAAQEIESVDAGVLVMAPDCPAPGDEVKVGTLLGYLLAPGESLSDTDTCSEPKPVINASDSNTKSVEVKSSPTTNTNSLLDEMTSESIASSPRARRVAAELGVDWRTLEGTGRDGRVRESDVRAAATNATSVRSPLPSVDKSTPLKTTGLSARRLVIAERLQQSQQRTVPVTLTTTLDATNLMALRAQFKVTKADVVPALTDIVASLAARVLARHSQFAVRWQESSTERRLVTVPVEQLDIGIAVHTDEGLLVPVLRDAARKPLLTLVQESQRVIERARQGRLSSSEMQSGVLSISNLGSYGIDAFTPVINYPEVMILGLGAIQRVAVVSDQDQIKPQSRMTLSLTFDHAAFDGAPVAEFLKTLVVAFENPSVLLLS